MVKTDDEEPPPFLEIASRELAVQRLPRAADLRAAIIEVFEHSDPNMRFVEFAKSYIGKPGKDVRAEDINFLAWYFGIDRRKLKRLLVSKSIVARKD